MLKGTKANILNMPNMFSGFSGLSVKYYFIHHNTFTVILLTLYTSIAAHSRANKMCKKYKFKTQNLKIHSASHLIQL